MRVSGPWINVAPTQALCAALAAAGFQALFVGGCVRNALLGVMVGDIDIATDAPPETVSDIAFRAGFRAVPTGIAHGTVTIIAGGIPHEVTTFRRDVETDGRRAVVAFSSELAEDAARRDFTMNALYARADGTVIDPMHGLPDLLARRVRFVGAPGARIREDYLRILRFFRFHAHYGDPDGGIDAEGLAACAALSAGLETLSAERITAETGKLLAARDPAPAVAAMAQAGVLARILPGADPQLLAPLVHLEAGAPPRWQRRLAVLGGDRAGLRLSRADSVTVAAIQDEIGSTHSPAALGFLHGAETAADIVLARAALLPPLPEGWQEAIARGAAARFPVAAADLPHLAGPALGAQLKDLRTRWLNSDLRLSREELLT
ncbi:CCA tRNA nucleotidyltransferase [Paracoccaceae bacterium]